MNSKPPVTAMLTVPPKTGTISAACIHTSRQCGSAVRYSRRLLHEAHSNPTIGGGGGGGDGGGNDDDEEGEDNPKRAIRTVASMLEAPGQSLCSF